MKIFLTILLLIPSLSWGDDFLKNLVLEIHQKITTQKISSNEGDFYLEQLSEATNVFKEYGSPCYQAQVKSNSTKVYDTNLDCLIIRSSLGITSDEFTSNLIKLREIMIFFQNMILEGKFDYSNEQTSKKRRNFIDISVSNFLYLKKATTFKPNN